MEFLRRTLTSLFITGDVTAEEFNKWRCDAISGDAIGQYNLGQCYRMGLNCTKDLLEATIWYKRAAAQGYVAAQYNLGVCYANGEGVLQDSVEAYAYFNLAGLTDEDARRLREWISKKMTPSQIEAGQERSKELQRQIEARKEEEDDE
jgi:uncharacterized protein